MPQLVQRAEPRQRRRQRRREQPPRLLGAAGPPRRLVALHTDTNLRWWPPAGRTPRTRAATTGQLAGDDGGDPDGGAHARRESKQTKRSAEN